MDGRDHRIREEAAELWRELYSEPPPAKTSGRKMLEIITARLGDSAYNRLRSPFLRPSTIVGPGQPKDETRLR